MERDTSGQREFARLNKSEWDEKTSWFDGVLFFVNGHEFIARGKKQVRGSFGIDFVLPGLPGEWTCAIDHLDDLIAPKTIEPIRSIMLEIAENGCATQNVWRKLKGIVGTVDLIGSASLGSIADKDTLYEGTATLSGPTQWMALLIAELIQRKFDDRLRVCELPTCDNFFVVWDRRGKPKAYCTDSHASQDRTAAARLKITTDELRQRRRRKRK